MGAMSILPGRFMAHRPAEYRATVLDTQSEVTWYRLDGGLAPDEHGNVRLPVDPQNPGGDAVETLEAVMKDAAKAPLTSAGAAELDWLRAGCGQRSHRSPRVGAPAGSWVLKCSLRRTASGLRGLAASMVAVLMPTMCAAPVTVLTRRRMPFAGPNGCRACCRCRWTNPCASGPCRHRRRKPGP